MQDQLYKQAARELGYCGRFKSWQMALMFMGGIMILSGGLPLLVLHFIPWVCRLVGLV